MGPIQTQMVICCAEQWMGGLFYQIEPFGDGLRLDRDRAATCIYCMKAVDSGESGFRWDRAVVEADLPPDTALRVYAYAADHRWWGEWEDLDEGLRSLEGDPARTIYRVFGPPAAHSGDFYLQCTGRYLWLAFELTTTGAESPVIHALRLWTGGDHMVDYLPAIYREGDFTRRFLSVFNSMYADMERAVDDLPALLDHEHTGGEMLRYLAGWVCVEQGGPAEQLRERIRTALPDYEDLYTVEGVRRSVRRLTGRDPILIEPGLPQPPRLPGSGAVPPALWGGPLPLLRAAAGGHFLQPAPAQGVPVGDGGADPRGDADADDPAQAVRAAGLAHLSGGQLPGGQLRPGGHRRAGDDPLRYHDRRRRL